MKVISSEWTTFSLVCRGGYHPPGAFPVCFVENVPPGRFQNLGY